MKSSYQSKGVQFNIKSDEHQHYGDLRAVFYIKRECQRLKKRFQILNF